MRSLLYIPFRVISHAPDVLLGIRTHFFQRLPGKSSLQLGKRQRKGVGVEDRSSEYWLRSLAKNNRNGYANSPNFFFSENIRPVASTNELDLWLGLKNT